MRSRHDRGRHEAGAAQDGGLRGLNQGHNYVRCPAEEEGQDDQEETNHPMIVLVLLGVLGGRLGGGLRQEGEQLSGCGRMLFCRISNCGSNIALLGQKVSTYMMDQRRGTARVLTALPRRTTGGRTGVQAPAALDRVLQGVDPPGVASSHLHDVHITEEDDQRRGEVREHGHEGRVAGSAGPVYRAAVHGNHVADGAPAEERRAAGGQGLQPDPQDHSTGPPQGAARAVVQAVHDGMVPVQGDGSQGQHRRRAVHRGGVTHVQAERLATQEVKHSDA